jgi:dnd system-associated protein 4
MTSVLNQKTLFSYDHTIYWPEKYERVIEYLKNGFGHGENSHSLYKLNVEVLVLAACVGLEAGNSLDFSSEKKKEVSLSTFTSQSLSVYLYLIPMLAEKETTIDFFRNQEGESRAVSIFEKYAAGGLEMLNEKVLSNTLDSPYYFSSNLRKARDGDIRDLEIDIF